MTKLLLAGATGMVGAAALALMLDDDRISQVVAPTRRPLKAHAKLLNPIIDSLTLPPDADWWAVDGAISALGTTRMKSRSAAAYRAIDHDFALAIAARARGHGAQRFALVTSMGADAKSWFLYTRIKGELEDSVDRLGFPSLTIVRPGFLGGERRESRPLERELGALLRIAAPILPASLRTSPARTVAEVLVEAALNGGPGTHIVQATRIAQIAEART